MKRPTSEQCDLCKAVNPPPADVVEDRGYRWHRPCSTIDQHGYVMFPSSGKLMPNTILSE